MEPTQAVYPVFEANQVLSDLHLNEIVNYLDEQERLTRANLIGIGIVCGLEINLEQSGRTTIRLTNGCGVTSQGYLIMEPHDVALVSYRKYILPDDLEYPPFKESLSSDQPFDLWELFPAGEPETTPLESPAGFLNDKAVVLFLELKKEGLRNCSPNDCDDRGSKITATVRRLLITVQDLDRVIAAGRELEGGQTGADLAAVVLERLRLSDLRLPRYDVLATGPATTREVLAAFLAVFQREKLVMKTGNALRALYEAFKPLVDRVYPSNPFAQFAARFGFLDSMPSTTAQVLFLPYYYDWFDDLLKAYDEVRWKGADLMCACCPSESLFPRHLMLGVLFPARISEPGLYRQAFLPSPTVGDCRQRTDDLVVLFQRLVEMIARFSESPRLPAARLKSLPDPQIRITPSKAGDVILSRKAIPYYYDQGGDPPLYRLWNPEQLRRKRAHLNLGYRSDEYVPTAPVFVRDALRYDLEPYDFLRIEGHLGKNYQDVVASLLTLRNHYRLPIEIIALRTGAFDETIQVDLSKEQCRFEDLEAQFDMLREEILWTLREGVRFLYDTHLTGTASSPPVGHEGVPQLPLLEPYRATFRVTEGTLGAWYEQNLARLNRVPYIDVDQDRIDDNTIFLVYCSLFAASTLVPDQFRAHVVGIYYFSKLAEILPQGLDALSFADFENKYQDLVGLLRYLRKDLSKAPLPAELAQFIPREEVVDHFDEVLYACKLEPMRALHQEYGRRIREVKRKQFLSTFLTTHPGIQHKAGVPIGGTFILVYHETPPPAVKQQNPPFFAVPVLVAGRSGTKVSSAATIDTHKVSGLLQEMSQTERYFSDASFAALYAELTGRLPVAVKPVRPDGLGKQTIDAAVEGLANGTVIADFFLPYLVCSSDCAPVQFVLPKAPPTFTVEVGCTDLSGAAQVRISPKGGEAPYSYRVGQSGEFKPWDDNTVLSLTAGTHQLTMQDGAGVESTSKTVVVPEMLKIGDPTFEDNATANTYQVTATISGGTQPYSVPAEVGRVEGITFTSAALASGATMTVEVTDSHGCKTSRTFTHTVCDLPCGGVSRLSAYRLWIQPPLEDETYKLYSPTQDPITLRFNDQRINLPGAETILQADPAELNRSFDRVMNVIVKKLNRAVNQALVAKLGDNGKDRLVMQYGPAGTDQPFSVLWIEHFVCDKFDLQFNFSFARPSPEFKVAWRYTNEPEGVNGAIMVVGDKETRVRAFGTSERNQCLGTRFEKLCQGPDPKIGIRIESSSDNKFTLKGNVQNMPVANVVSWVWDVSAQPDEPFYEGMQVNVAVKKASGVRLTAITTQGCFGMTHKAFPQ